MITYSYHSFYDINLTKKNCNYRQVSKASTAEKTLAQDNWCKCMKLTKSEWDALPSQRLLLDEQTVNHPFTEE